VADLNIAGASESLLLQAVCPRVSIVMSVFNGIDSLEGTLRSVFVDSAPGYELILVDDGSTDGAAELLDEICRHDPRAHVIHQENTGLTQALIRGCQEARGDYIARIDCGDVSFPGRLQKQAAILDSDSSIAFVSCWTRVAVSTGESLYISKGSGAAVNARWVIDPSVRNGLVDGPSHHGSVMFRRKNYLAVGGYRPEFYYGQDWDLWYRLAEVGKFQMIPEVLYEARVSPGDISMNQKRRQEEIARCSLAAMKLRSLGKSDAVALESAAKIRPSRSQRPRLGKNFRGNYFIGETLRRNGDFAAASKYLWEAAKANPFYLKSWLRLCQLAIR
jgi:glycosyltransferase involved in cell wall biosynthesis